MAIRIATWGLTVFLAGAMALGCGRVGFEEITNVAPEATDSADASESEKPIVVLDSSSPDFGRNDSPADTVDATLDAVDVTPAEGGCSTDACTVCTSDAECRCASFAHAYRFCSVARTWADAESRCETAGMRLARVDDAAENAWIRASADGLGIGYAWLGMADPTHTSVWQWVDGTIFWMGDETGGPVGGLYENWNAAHPTGTTIRACGGLLSGQYAGEWDDRSCSSVLAYVCEAY